MPKYERHVFICINERSPGHPRGSCHHKQSTAVAAAFKEALKARGLTGRVRANKAQCLDQCEHGPTVVVYPEQVWYGFVRPEDVEEVVDHHLIHNHPVSRLMLPDGCVHSTQCPHLRGDADPESNPPQSA